MPINPATIASLCTVRIEADGDAGSSLGTGYFYNIETAADDPGFVNITPLIVTNKHVVAGARVLKFTLDVIKKDEVVGEDGSVPWQERHVFEIDRVSEAVIMHPDPDVDLCVIQMGYIFGRLNEGFTLKNTFMSAEWRLSEASMQFVRPIEPIIMVGYPNGIWDAHNNRPITRQGLSASHCLVKWNDKRYFVIDCACFPGSSGSPVFLYEDGMFRTDRGHLSPGTRLKLLGTLWGGPTYTAEGRLIAKPIPSLLSAGSEVVPVVSVMMNLGFVIHVDALDDFKPLVIDLLRKENSVS